MQQDCQHCSCSNDATIPGEKGNFLLHVYERQPWFSHLELMCKQCHALSVFYFGPNKWPQYGSQLRDLGLTVVMEAFAPDDMVERWRIMYELPKLCEHKLTKRHEGLLTALHDVLGTIPDDLLWDELVNDPPHTDLPQDWI